jgi:predicted P-loop ATPase
MSGENWAAILDCTEKGLPRPTLANIALVLQHDPQFSADLLHYDSFKDRILIANSPQRELRSDDISRTRVYLQESIPGLERVTKADVRDAIELVAWGRQRHCVREALSAVTWDDEPRLDTWLMTYLGAVPSEHQSDSYLRAAGRNTLLSLVARVFTPGCQVDTMLVLEGPQGIGKTSALRILGGEFYRVALESMTGKDFLQALRGAWLMEIAELSSTSRADVERIKVIISTPSDPYRPSYGAFTLTYPRQCIFIGTTNRDDYLLDETGGRRFHPVRVGAITLQAFARDRDQILAEAMVRMQAGEAWHVMPDDTATIQAARCQSDPWVDSLTDYLTGKDRTTIADVAINCFKFRESDISDREAKRIGKMLRGLKWERRSIRWNGKPVQGYRAPDSGDED